MVDRVIKVLLAAVLTSVVSSSVLAASAPGADDYQKASELLAKGSFQEALTYLDKAVKADPKNAEAFMDRALCNFHLGNYKKVLEDCKEVTSNPTTQQQTVRQAYMMSAGAHNALGEYNDAVQSSDKAIGLAAPRASLLFSDRAFAFKQLKRFDEALRDVDMAIKLDPMHASNYELRASIFEMIAARDRLHYRDLTQAGGKPGDKTKEKAPASSGAKTAADAEKK